MSRITELERAIASWSARLESRNRVLIMARPLILRHLESLKTSLAKEKARAR